MNKRRENFIRIAENRTNRIIDLIELLGNLSNKSYYDYDDEQVKKMFSAIQKSLDNQKVKFKYSRKKFKL